MIDMSWIQAHQGLLLSLAGLSVLMFVGSLISLPFLLARIPEDYFVDPQRHSARMKSLHPVAYVSLRLLKNLVGWVLVLAGILMLVLPGQGILTIIMGLVLSDFPGKYTLERRIASNRRVLNGINWIRRRGGHAPIVPPRISNPLP